MRIIGIVAEYNPFHNGHKFLIDTVKRSGDIVIAVMSGNFVQRGDVAVFEKFERAEAALFCGVDLVLELPVESALSSARDFALAAVDILIAAGATHIAFGSECGDISMLRKAAAAADDERVNETTVQRLRAGETYAKARSEAVAEIFGEDTAFVLNTPNDILAVEYIRAVNELGALEPIAVKRVGAMHDDRSAVGTFAGAMAVRELILSGQDYRNFVPETAYNIYKDLVPARIENAESAVLCHLRRMNADDFSVYDVSEGLHNRIYSAVRTAGSLNELQTLIKTKRYTLSRIRRVIMNAVLETSGKTCPYLRVLGFTESGADLLRGISKPVVSSYKTAKAQNFADYFEWVSKTTDFYALCMDKPAPCDSEFVRSVLKI